MKLFQALSLMTALLMMAFAPSTATAGHLLDSCGSCKSTCCDVDCQPECCKPTIVRPCTRNVYTYQRACSTIKPPCCDNGCCSVDSCGPACGPAPCAPACAAPCEPACGTDCAPACGTCDGCGTDGCGDDCCGMDCCDYDPCELAQLIYESQTACYARQRRRALHKLGSKFNCRCTPEIMTAFIYGLNDADERVRKEAADEIGDQIRKYGCCCTPELTTALTCALADCDRGVRRQAEQSLRLCGYDIVDGCCEDEVCCEAAAPCCESGCTSCAPAAPSPAPAPAGEVKALPIEKAPVPPAEIAPASYFPAKVHEEVQAPAPRKLSSVLSTVK